MDFYETRIQKCLGVPIHGYRADGILPNGLPKILSHAASLLFSYTRCRFSLVLKFQSGGSTESEAMLGLELEAKGDCSKCFLSMDKEDPKY